MNVLILLIYHISCKIGSLSTLCNPPNQRRGVLRSLGKSLCRPHWIHKHCPRLSRLFSSAGTLMTPPPSTLWQIRYSHCCQVQNILMSQSSKKVRPLKKKLGCKHLQLQLYCFPSHEHFQNQASFQAANFLGHKDFYQASFKFCGLKIGPLATVEIVLQVRCGVWGGGAEKADGLYSARLPGTALMNPRGKRGGAAQASQYICSVPLTQHPEQ